MSTRVACFSLLLIFSTGACASTRTLPPAVGDSQTPVNVTGRWDVTISLNGETIPGVAVLEQSNDRVTGSMGPDTDNQHPLEGVIEGPRVVITMRPRPGRTTLFDRSRLAVDGETLVGTTEGGPAEGASIRLVRQRQ